MLPAVVFSSSSEIYICQLKTSKVCRWPCGWLGVQLCKANGADTPDYDKPDEAACSHIEAQLVGALKALVPHAR